MTAPTDPPSPSARSTLQHSDAGDAAGEPAIETIRSLEELEALGGEWDELVRAMPRPSPFLLHAWLMEWWRHFGSGASLAVLTARRDGRLVGALPITVRRRGASRVARFVGAHESALADLLLAEGEGAATASRLRDALLEEPFDYVDLFGLPGDSRLVGATEGQLRVIERVSAPVMLMPSGWQAAYEAKTNSKRRNLHRRRLRQLEEDRQGAVSVSVARTGDELEPMLAEAFRLHDLRWQGRPDGSTFGTSAGKAFNRAALRRLADQGFVRLVVLSTGEDAVAFDCMFVIERTTYLYRLGFDPALSRFSPGLLATLETLRVVGDEGVTRVEFLGGGERYKVELADELNPMLQGIGLGRTLYGRAAARQRLGLIQLRMRLREVEPLHALYAKGGLLPFRGRR